MQTPTAQRCAVVVRAGAHGRFLLHPHCLWYRYRKGDSHILIGCTTTYMCDRLLAMTNLYRKSAPNNYALLGRTALLVAKLRERWKVYGEIVKGQTALFLITLIVLHVCPRGT